MHRIALAGPATALRLQCRRSICSCPTVLIALLVGLIPRPAECDDPRHLVHADVLALARKGIGVSYEHVGHGATSSLLIGAGAASDVQLAVTGFAVEEVDLDEVGGGLQFRYYGRGAPAGWYATVAASYVYGNGTGHVADGNTQRYRLDGLETSLLGVGYQAIFFRRLALDGNASFRLLAGYLRAQDGGESGRAGSYGIVFAGFIGVAF